MGSIIVVQLVESAFGENNQSSEVTTWSKLDNVKSVNVASIDSWKILGSSLDISGIVSVDDEWSLSQDVFRVSVFTSSISEALLSSNLGKIFTNSKAVECGDEGFAVWGIELINNKWQFWDSCNLVTSGHDERCDRGSSKS